jgi:hypothetical protein
MCQHAILLENLISIRICQGSRVTYQGKATPGWRLQRHIRLDVILQDHSFSRQYIYAQRLAITAIYVIVIGNCNRLRVINIRNNNGSEVQSHRYNIRGGLEQLFFESAIAIPELEGSTYAIAISQLFKEMLLRNRNSEIAIFSEVRNLRASIPQFSAFFLHMEWLEINIFTTRYFLLWRGF